MYNARQIDNVLPQMQCGLCGYKGCWPYAKAIAQQQAPIDRCPPGGIKTLLALAKITQQNPTPYLASMQEKTKPPMQAIIRESECVGCTKCIQACPVDAIIGAAKQMHTVLTAECTGCELCIAPCPVDCIDLVELAAPLYEPHKARQRFQARQKRLLTDKALQTTISKAESLSARKAYIQAAIARAKEKS